MKRFAYIFLFFFSASALAQGDFNPNVNHFRFYRPKMEKLHTDPKTAPAQQKEVTPVVPEKQRSLPPQSSPYRMMTMAPWATPLCPIIFLTELVDKNDCKNN